MNNKFTPDDILVMISEKINDLKDMVKKYPLLSFDLGALESKVIKEIKSQIKDPELVKEKVLIPVRKQKIVGQTIEKEKKEIEQDYFKKNVKDLQFKKFKNEYKRWLQNLIVLLNQMQAENKKLNIKKIIEPFMLLDAVKSSSYRKDIVRKVLAKIGLVF